MLTPGHIASSYILAETGKQLGLNITSQDIIFIIIAGNLPDIDFFWGLVTGKTDEQHHQNITHTPLGVFLMWILFLITLKPTIPVSILLLLSLLLHLFLDDLGYILGKLKLHKLKVNSQINWLYPFRKYKKQKMITRNIEVLKHYITYAKPVFLLELILVITAIVIFLLN